MKKTLLTLIMVMAIGCLATNAIAVDLPPQALSVTVATALSIEFDAASCVFPGTTIPWTNVNPTQGAWPTGGHNPAKPDVAIICRNNGSTWYLKMHLTSATLAGKISHFISQPINRNTGTVTNGTVLPSGTNWYPIQSSPSNVYASNDDTVNTPLGTFIGIYYMLIPTGLAPGVTHSGAITYTLSNTL